MDTERDSGPAPEGNNDLQHGYQVARDIIEDSCSEFWDDLSHPEQIIITFTAATMFDTFMGARALAESYRSRISVLENAKRKTNSAELEQNINEVLSDLVNMAANPLKVDESQLPDGIVHTLDLVNPADTDNPVSIYTVEFVKAHFKKAMEMYLETLDEPVRLGEILSEAYEKIAEFAKALEKTLEGDTGDGFLREYIERHPDFELLSGA